MIVQRVNVRTEVEELDIKEFDVMVLNQKYHKLFGNHIQRLHLPTDLTLELVQEAFGSPDYGLAGWFESIGEDDWGDTLCLRSWLNNQFEQLVDGPAGNYRVDYDEFVLIEGKDTLI